MATSFKNHLKRRNDSIKMGFVINKITNWTKLDGNWRRGQRTCQNRCAQGEELGELWELRPSTSRKAAGNVSCVTKLQGNFIYILAPCIWKIWCNFFLFSIYYSDRRLVNGLDRKLLLFSYFLLFRKKKWSVPFQNWNMVIRCTHTL